MVGVNLIAWQEDFIFKDGTVVCVQLFIFFTLDNIPPALNDNGIKGSSAALWIHIIAYSAMGYDGGI